ncbi:Gfo/Idh/MocA family protein [Capnocytophaga canimorsus]|uniref:Gfo/Idh/MocA family protein n=1 Tax=Capnocytophaga canimorsus TaxID=28188 RepID=UPI000D6E8707|nr:Gfo/Idh/MocA family oxidoreductase [Capnocytophaga canimorsus]AWL78805.1 acetylgalactosaminidase [Capnocytophaga canimorsus]
MRKSVFDLKVAPIPNLTVGFIGIGIRGIEAVKRYTALGVNIGAICDPHQEYIEKAQQITTNAPKKPIFFSEENDWQKLCQLPEIDLIYISTPWEWHTDMAVFAMQCGKHVAIEVPLAMTVADCQKIVLTAEQTQRHCMMLENACYDTFELTTLSLIKKGLLGEIVHAEGAYIHDLRKLNFLQNERDTLRGQWRIKYSQWYNGNPYPTHGIGPICQAMNILRTDHLVKLVSMSSATLGMKHYAENTFGKNSQQAQISYTMGDMNTTLIQTQLGKTIVLQHDVTSPRPYSRRYLISGTCGFVEKYPAEQITFDPNGMEPLSAEATQKIMEENKPLLIKQTEDLCQKLPEQKPMDIRMDYRLVHCLKNGLALDQNVYDGALWSAFVELTQKSVSAGSLPIPIPNFLP